MRTQEDLLVLPLSSIFDQRMTFLIVLAPTLLSSLFPSSAYGLRTSVMAELSFRKLRYQQLGVANKPRALITVLEDIIAAMARDDILPVVQTQQAMTRPVQAVTINATKQQKKKVASAAKSVAALESQLNEAKLLLTALTNTSTSTGEADNVLSQWSQAGHKKPPPPLPKKNC
jgi:hypothetical protein